jgi:hypothetical protein
LLNEACMLTLKCYKFTYFAHVRSI